MTNPIPSDDQVDIWVDAECYVSDAENPTVAQDGTFGPEWLLIGLLNGSDGFGNNREWETTSATAWGKGEVASADKNFRSTGSFNALESNEVTHGLLWPGSTQHVLVVPKPRRVFIAYQTENQDGDTEILITRRRARVFAPDASRNDENAGRAFEVQHYADGQGGLFDRILVDAETGQVTEIAPIRISGLTTPEKPIPLGGDNTPEEEPAGP